MKVLLISLSLLSAMSAFSHEKDYRCPTVVGKGEIIKNEISNSEMNNLITSDDAIVLYQSVNASILQSDWMNCVQLDSYLELTRKTLGKLSNEH
jgi:predicted nucleotide-binding protein (sugar kinase/HSP70/actin superfamily)